MSIKERLRKWLEVPDKEHLLDHDKVRYAAESATRNAIRKVFSEKENEWDYGRGLALEAMREYINLKIEEENLKLIDSEEIIDNIVARIRSKQV